ncbi:TolC family protein [Candidatus Bipolaricaulota bacterium]|nr:TolC family protein [Candidatus Bipolaricaulota bacterium]
MRGLVAALVGMALPLALTGRELPLGEAIAIALSQAPEVRQAELELSLAELELSAARAGMALPSLSLVLMPPGLTQAGLSTAEAELSASLSLPWGTSSRLAAGLGLGWTDAGPAISSWNVSGAFTLDLADPTAAASQFEDLKEAVEEARESLEELKDSKALEVIATYLELLSLQAQLEKAQEDLVEAEGNLTKLEEKATAGLVGDLELAEARLAVLEARIALEEKNASFAARKADFLSSLGLDGEGIELVKPDIPQDELISAAEGLLSQEELAQAAVELSQAVQAAQREVEQAEETLRKAQAAGLPTLTLQAGLTEGGLKLGWEISFSLFAPARGTEIQIAQKELALARLKLERARMAAFQEIRNSKEDLKAALRDLERLPMEKERWNLEEEVMRAKHEAGAISDEDWQDFLEEKEAFLLEAEQRLGDLLIAYLAYRDALGLSLDWEGWLK